MKKPTLHTRWHCFNKSTDQKVIRRFGVNETQPTQHDANFTPWVRGTGPHTEEARQKTIEANRKHFKGKPKSDITKERMSQAHLGKKFTAEHRKKLKDGWKSKREYKRLRMIEAFRLAAEVGEAHYNTND